MSATTKWLGACALMMAVAVRTSAQTANFNFSSSVQHVTGWTNVLGDPSKGVRTGTSSGITVSSVATANWAPDANGNCAYDGGGVSTAGFFATGVMKNTWYQYGTANASVLNVSQPQLKITGLQANTIYTIRISGSFNFGFMMDPTLYTVMGQTNYGAIPVNGNNDVDDGAVFNNIMPDSTGSVRIYINTGNGSNVACVSGLQVQAGLPVINNLTPGIGLAQLGNTLSLGDSVTGVGPHSFTSNRYQFLNGHQYSFGGSVNDPVNHPVFRMYDNGDLTAGTTMDRSVNTVNQQGLRYYNKIGYLQIGASDRLDTTVSRIDYGVWPSSGIFINSGDTNTLKGKIMNTVFSNQSSIIDSGYNLENNFVSGEQIHYTGSSQYAVRSFINGVSDTIGTMDASVVVLKNSNIGKLAQFDLFAGSQFHTADSSWGTIAVGSNFLFGGPGQLLSGNGLINRSPDGAALGNYNVDFPNLAFSGIQGVNIPGIAGYPLFVLGNAATGAGTIRSNAMTVLYNGRTQINTSGHTNSLTQAQVTPQAALDVVSTNTGVLLPRLTTAQRNAIASGDLLNGLLLYNTDSSIFQYYNGAAWNSVGFNSSSAHWSFLNGTTYDSLDNIAIGTSNPQGYKLAVNGSAIFTQVKVKPLANWPDYVFRKGYPLPGLQDLDRYIHLHHHLPGISSARDVKRDGMDVGAQQAAMLKKVEELTLYLIQENKTLTEQHKQLGNQNAVLQAQQKEIDELKAMLLQQTEPHPATK